MHRPNHDLIPDSSPIFPLHADVAAILEVLEKNTSSRLTRRGSAYRNYLSNLAAEGGTTVGRAARLRQLTLTANPT